MKPRTYIGCGCHGPTLGFGCLMTMGVYAAVSVALAKLAGKRKR